MNGRAFAKTSKPQLALVAAFRECAVHAVLCCVAKGANIASHEEREQR